MARYQKTLVSLLRAGIPQKEAEARARKVGDPGIGWADNVVSDPDGKLWVALPYEDWQAKWRTKAHAHGKPLIVTINGQSVRCLLGDTMPHKANIKNGAVIDLAPAVQKAFGLKPPFMVDCEWSWA